MLPRAFFSKNSLIGIVITFIIVSIFSVLLLIYLNYLNIKYPQTWIYLNYVVSISFFVLSTTIAILIFYNLSLKRIQSENAHKIAKNITREINKSKELLERSYSELRINEKQLELVLNSFPGFVVWLNKENRIIGTNEEFAIYLNKNYKDLINTLIDSLESETNASFFNAIKNFQENTAVRKLVPIELTRQSSTKYMMMTLQKYNNNQNLLIVCVDYTEQKNLEIEIQNTMAKTSYASKMSAIGEMVGNIAHEINNPLAVISSSAQFISTQMSDGQFNTTLINDMAKKIVQTSIRISKIIKSLRVIARDGTHDPFEKVSLQQIISESLDLCQNRIQKNRINFSIVQPTEDVLIEVRESQIVQIIINLINNSIDAVEKNADKNIELQTKISEKYIDIIVTDNGPEIPKDVKAKIMNPFFTTKPVGKGTGLGLSISKGIADSHNGVLYLNTKSSNTQFILRLPKNQNEAI